MALNATSSNAIASSSKMPLSSAQYPHASTLLKREATEDISTDVDGDDDDDEEDDDVEGGRSRDGPATARGDSRSALTEGGRGPDGAPIRKKKSASKKKKANRACAACQKAHLTCDDARPCTRCVKKGIADQCTDGKRKRAKYLLDEDELEAVKARERADRDQKDRDDPTATGSFGTTAIGVSNQASSHPAEVARSSMPPPPPFMTHPLAAASAHQPLPPSSFQVPESATSEGFSNHLNNDFQSNLSAGPSTGPTHDDAAGSKSQPATSQTTPPYAFGSEATSLEYSILSAMLNGIDPSLLTGSPDNGMPGALSGGYAAGNLTPGGSVAPNGGLDFTGWLGNSGDAGNVQNLPSVGMATDPSSYWLSNGPTAGGGIGSASGAGNASSSNQNTSRNSVGNAAERAPGLVSMPSPWSNATQYKGRSARLTSVSEPLAQLHAIGGQGSTSNEGEVGSGGFKALEVPSPSPSLVNSRLGREGETASSPAESTQSSNIGKTAVAAAAAQSSGIDSHGRSQQGGAGVAPSSNGGLADFESQWRERVSHIYGDLTKPFSYTEGYHFLLKFVTDKFEKAEVLRIVRALGLFRPSLIALQMPLTDEDEVFVERSIQRTILEFEKLISFSGTPTLVWRRTCEICVVGSEFSMLTGWTRDVLLGRRIYEFWDKSSTLEYWEKFASHAFENTSQSIVANVVLKRPDGSSVPCAACFSIKRNVFDLPSLVVGAFLPMLSSVEGA
ncbi:unnamed protein product [Jaminaea pallidilutea]